MPSQKVAALTQQDIIRAANRFVWTRQIPKWTVIVNRREFPARPLVLDAAGVPPNDPTNSHQAVAILKDCGFAVRYEGKTIESEDEGQALSSSMDKLITSLRGCCKGSDSLVEAREREHRDDRY